MTKLMMCGCGGKPRHEVSTSTFRGTNDERHYISCDKCSAMVMAHTYEDAIEEWNTAMSGNRMRIHTVILDDAERSVTAKPFKDHKNDRRWICGSCGSAVSKVWKYCQKCGTEIDWSVRDGIGKSD